VGLCLVNFTSFSTVFVALLCFPRFFFHSHSPCGLHPFSVAAIALSFPVLICERMRVWIWGVLASHNSTPPLPSNNFPLMRSLCTTVLSAVHYVCFRALFLQGNGGEIYPPFPQTGVRLFGLRVGIRSAGTKK
jgi:hypothetical protein